MRPTTDMRSLERRMTARQIARRNSVPSDFATQDNEKSAVIKFGKNSFANRVGKDAEIFIASDDINSITSFDIEKVLNMIRNPIISFKEIILDDMFTLVPAKRKMLHIAIYMNNIGHYSGGRYYLIWMAFMMATMGHKVTVFSDRKPFFINDFDYVDIGENRIEWICEKRFHKTKGFVMVAENKFDFIVESPLAPNGFVYAKKHGVPLIAVLFESPNYISQFRMGMDSTEEYWAPYRAGVLDGASILMTISQQSLKYGLEWLEGFKGRSDIVYPAINTYIADRIQGVEEKNEIVFVGRHVEFKNPDAIVNVLSKIDKSIRPSVNYIGGHSHKMRDRILALADANNVKVRFYANVTDAEKFHIIKRSKVLIFLSCIAKDEEIVTENGFEKIQDIRVGTKVLTHTGCMNKVEKVIYQGSKDICELKPYLLPSIKLTDDHKMLIYNIADKSITWKCISDIDIDKDCVLMPKHNYNKDFDKLDFCDYIDLDNYYFDDNYLYAKCIQNGIEYKMTRFKYDRYLNLTDDIMKFFGFYVSEGCCSATGDIMFCFNSNEKEYIQFVCKVIDKVFNGKYKVTILDRHRCIIRFTNKLLSKVLTKLFGRVAKDKFVNKDIIYLPIEKLKFFIECAWKGDGSINVAKSGLVNCQYSTCSANLAKCISFILWRMNIINSVNNYESYDGSLQSITSICRLDNIKKFVDLIDYNIVIERNIIHPSKAIAKCFELNDYFAFHIKSISRMIKKSDVYDLTVQDDHSFVCGFHIVKNCFEGFGMSPAEGIYCNKPVIVYDIPVIRDTYGDSVDYVKSGDLTSVADKIREYITKPKTALRQAERAKLAYYRVENPIPCLPQYMKKALRRVFYNGKDMSITAGMIVLNGADTIKLALTSIYEAVDKIIIVEGAVEDYAKNNVTMHDQGHSIDNTLEIINNFDDPLNKIELVTIDHFWKNKNEMQNEIAKRVTTDLYLKVDSDEIFLESDIEYLKRNFTTDDNLWCISLLKYEFWKDLKTIACGGQWDRPQARIWRWRSDFRHPESKTGFNHFIDKDGVEVKAPNYKCLNLNEKLCYHLGYCRNSDQIRAKINYYKNRGIEVGVTDNYSEWKEGMPTNSTHPIGTGVKPFDGKLPKILQEYYFKNIVVDPKERYENIDSMISSPPLTKV